MKRYGAQDDFGRRNLLELAFLRKYNTKEYRRYAKKLSWLSECLYYALWMYGIFTKDVLLTLFNSRKGLHISKEELEQLCAEFPKDLMMCCWSEDKNTIVADDLMKPAEPWRYESLQKEQDGKDFYFPETSELEDFYRNGYPAGQAEFQELGRMMIEWGGVERGDVPTHLFTVWKRIQNGADLEELLDYLGGLASEDEEKYYRIVSLVQNLNNRTRLRSNRGHTPEELFLQMQEQGETAGPLTVAPGSTVAADLLETASDDWREWESGLIWRAMRPGRCSRTERFRRSIRTILVRVDPGRSIRNVAGEIWYEESTESPLYRRNVGKANRPDV